jgi:L-ascorbate metabolism protein UlaG (beta-lactamase superfamily)
VELEANGEHLLVDHLLDPGVMAAFFGQDRDELIAPDPGSARAALVTHLHRDHADVAAIERGLGAGGLVLRPVVPLVASELDEIATGEAESAFAESPLDVRQCAVGDSHQVGSFSVTATFASDGLGSPQVSWLVRADGQTVLHAGDTLWHGSWWDVALAHGPIDVACLPANGVEVDYPRFQPPVAVPAAMTPEQAVEAARAVGARVLIPIHYNRTFEHDRYYRPMPDAREQIEIFAAKRDVNVLFAEPGEWHEVISTPAQAGLAPRRTAQRS